MNRSQAIRAAALAVVWVGLPIAEAAGATTLYWDGNSTSAGAGATPAGTWGVSVFWNDQSNGGGGGTIGSWQPGSTAVIAAGGDAVGAYTVTVSGTQIIAGINLEEGTVSFNSGTIDLGSTGATISAASGTTATFNSILAGNGGRLTKTGGGTIALGTIINQFNTFTGGVAVNGGVVQFQGEQSVVGNSNNPLGVLPTNFVPDQIRLDNGGVLSSTRVSSGGSVFVNTNRGIQLGAGGGTVDITDATANNSLFYAGVISGTGALTKTGPGTIQLQNINTYQGDTYAVAGGLGVNATATFGNGSGTLHLDGGAIVDFLTRTDSNRIANPISMSADTVMRNTSSQTTGVRVLPLNSPINATGGTLTIRNVGSGTSSFNVRLHADGFNFARPIVIDHGVGSFTAAALECINDNPVGVQTFNGIISGNGSIIRNATSAGMGGSTELLASNSYAGGTFINRGFIGLGDDTAAGTGTIMFGAAGNPDDASVGLYAVGGARNLANNIVFNVTTHVTFRGTNAVNFNGSADLGGTTRLITIDNPSVTFANSISGNGSAGITKDGTGTLVLSAANFYSGTTTINDGKLILGSAYSSSSPIIIQNAGALELSETLNGETVLRMGAVTLGVSGKIDLKNNKLITTDSVSSVAALVASGRNGTAWTGPGLVTSQSAAQNSNFTALAVAAGSDVKPESATETSVWAGQVITGTDTLVMYTYGGDANLDGKINIDDYVRIDQGIAAGYTGWSNGDFNYDGKINIDDYTTVIDSNIANQGPPFFSSSGSGISAVPEPIATTVLIFPAMLTIVRRRRRCRPSKAHG